MSAAKRRTAPQGSESAIRAEGLTVSYGPKIIQRDLNFSVRRGDIFVIMGGSGCGKSSLMRVLMGLLPPGAGKVLYGEEDFWAAPSVRRAEIMRRVGVLFQSGALWSSRTLAENVTLPLEYYTSLPSRSRRAIASLKLAQVGLAGFEDYYPSEISGGMKKRAGLARALALDPEIVFFDEPSAGLDPLSAAQLDELILELRDNMGMTVIMVTHELPSIFAVADDAIFLDAKTRTLTAQGNPYELLRHGPEEVARFLRRGKDPEDERGKEVGDNTPDGDRRNSAPGADI